MTQEERERWAVYAAIVAALATKSPKRVEVARALEALVRPDLATVARVR